MLLSSVGDRCSPNPAPPLDDADGDGLTDGQEQALGTCPGLQPTFQTLSQCHVGSSLANPLISDPKDSDGDGLEDAHEYFTYFTNPLLADSDGDGIVDGTEVDATRTSPTAADSDQDTLPDGVEHFVRLTNPVSPNTDGDFCSDPEELGANHVLGGDRDPVFPWDYFDVPVPALTSTDQSGTRNKAVTLSDVSAVLFYVGTKDGQGPNVRGVSYNTDLNGDDVPDGIEYDRAPSSNPAKRWRSRAPDGAVTLSDVAVDLAQVGDSCQAPP